MCAIEYEQAQPRVNAKYDTWQKDIWSQVERCDPMEMYATVLKARSDLE